MGVHAYNPSIWKMKQVNLKFLDFAPPNTPYINDRK